MKRFLKKIIPTRLQKNLRKPWKRIKLLQYNTERIFRTGIGKIIGLVNVREELAIFVPSSAGHHNAVSNLTLLSANQTFPFLSKFAETFHDRIPIYSVEDFCAVQGKKNEDFITKIKQKFDTYGSDKTTHNYYLVYSQILGSVNNITGLLEIGMGTNNTNIVSNMGNAGMPGASLRAFRDCLPNAMIYGADIDKGILFEEDRIKTYFVDQTNPKTFEELNNNISCNLDLIIDDGLHSPNANIATLTFALSKQKNQKNGWVVIEDIPERALPIWKVISFLIPSALYNSYLIDTNESYLFACQKISDPK